METRKMVDHPANRIHTAMNGNRNLHLRRLSSSRSKNVAADPDTESNTRLRSTKERPSAKQKKDRRRAQARRRWKIPLALVFFVLLFYGLNPSESNTVYPLIFLSYKTSSGRDEYGKGLRDLAFVGFYTVVLFFAREFFMQEVFRPLVASRGSSTQARFAEQAYVALYTGLLAGPLGLFVMAGAPATTTSSSFITTSTTVLWHFDTASMYAAYPHQTLSMLAKAYYLLQAAFWAQQVLVMALGLERRRKDFRELVLHHVVTVVLIALSYRFHFTVMGVVVFVTHDISDFFLAMVKALNYIDNPLQGPCYALCIAFWVYLRHYVNLKILLSILTEYHIIGPYVLDWDAGLYKCGIARVITFSLLAALQALNLFWLYCLLRNGYRFVVLGVAKDDREEEEDKEGRGMEDAKRDS
ncbi:TLC domain-containing protein [Nemania sp. FL0916]|nr:TLC domain-containing protein [Nemania sp. FL0916]